VFVLIFSTNFTYKISHPKKNWAIYGHKCNYVGVNVKDPLLLSDFNEMNFFDIYSKNPQIPNFMTILCSGLQVVPYRWTGITMLIVTFRNFARAPKIKCWETINDIKLRN